VHGDLVPEGMPPYPATQLGLPKELGQPAAEIGPPQAEALDAVEDPIEDETAAVPLSLPRFQPPDIQPVGRSATSQDNGTANSTRLCSSKKMGKNPCLQTGRFAKQQC